MGVASGGGRTAAPRRRAVPDPPLARRMRASPAVAAALISASVAACGFRPLHAPGGGAPEGLAGIEIAHMPDRLGQVVRNRLLDLLTPRGPAAAPAYRLAVSLRASKEALAITREASATRFNVSLEADYVLSSIATGEAASRGRARAAAAYNVVASDYANVVAERDAERRAAREIADELKTRVAAFLARDARRRPGGAGGPP